MGHPGYPTEREITEAIETAKEALEAVINDEESWFDRVMAAASRGFEDSSMRTALTDEYRRALFVMMQELVRTRPIVLSARAEPRINSDCSPTLRAAVDDYENV